MNKINIREANISDAAGLARVSVDSWRSTYSGIIPQEYLDSLTYENRTSRWEERLSNLDGPGFTFIVEDGFSNIIGYAGGLKGNSGNLVYTGEVGDIYLQKEFQGMGIGRRLMATVALRLKEFGHNSLLIWVFEENPYRIFYESLGGILIDEKEIESGGTKLTGVAYGWADMRVFGELFKSD
jgi:GNAT superfamily N-acetyltransferase